ncbi:MAG TPA: hypothetical protein VKE74_16315 [Gemmataceae bacterium]|nr:hypothetical protein [Gemmataceae bacterium]
MDPPDAKGAGAEPVNDTTLILAAIEQGDPHAASQLWPSAC